MLCTFQVNRSTALLKSLSAERERWEKTSETFKNQMSTIAGDCLLSAAFITYAGYFEQQMRQNLFTTWSHHLQQANIQVCEALIQLVIFDSYTVSVMFHLNVAHFKVMQFNN